MGGTSEIKFWIKFRMKSGMTVSKHLLFSRGFSIFGYTISGSRGEIKSGGRDLSLPGHLEGSIPYV